MVPADPQLSDPAWVRPGDVLLLVGPHKTGTTSLQTAFAKSRAALADAGVLYPGDETSQRRAAAAVLGRRTGDGTVPEIGHWDELVAEVADRSEPVLISSEFFCEAPPADIARIRDTWGSRLRVVISLRPLERLLPSTWQQAVKAGMGKDYDVWLHNVLDEPGRAVIWRRFDTAAMIDRWGDAIGPERVAAIVLDEANPGSQLDDIERLLGITAGTVTPSRVRNRSLTAAEAEAIRRVYGRLRGRVNEPLRQRWLRRGGIASMVEGYQPAADAARITTPSWAIERARAEQLRMCTAMQESGALIVGDVSRLVLDTPMVGTHPAFPEELPSAAVAELVAGVLTAAEADRDRLLARLERLRERQQRGRIEKVRVEVPADLTQSGTRQLLAELARRTRARSPFGRSISDGGRPADGS